MSDELSYAAERGCVDFQVTAGYPETTPCTECLPWSLEVLLGAPDDPDDGPFSQVWLREWHALACPVLSEDRASVREQHIRDGNCPGNNPELLCPSCNPEHPTARRRSIRQEATGGGD